MGAPEVFTVEGYKRGVISDEPCVAKSVCLICGMYIVSGSWNELQQWEQEHREACPIGDGRDWAA